MKDYKNKNKKRTAPKKMPGNYEAEQSLLGAIIINNRVGNDVLSLLQEKDFYYDSHKQIFLSMFELQMENLPVDIVTLTDRLEKKNVLDKVGGINYLGELTEILPSAANYKHYLDIVKRDSLLRDLINGSERIIENAYDEETTDADFALAFAEKVMFDISDGESSRELIHAGVIADDVLMNIEALLKNEKTDKGLYSGFGNLDDYVNGFKPGQLVVLAARPGVGKTSYVLNIVANIINKHPDKKIAMFNLEMSSEELLQRMMIIMARVPYKSILKGDADAGIVNNLWKAKKLLSDSNLYVDDTAVITPMQITSKCRRLAQTKGGLDMVVVDYLQLLKSDIYRESKQSEVSELSRSMKILAKELKVPVFLLSQMSRDVEKRAKGAETARPKLSDLRDSGAIEQDADMVFFLHNTHNSIGADAEIYDLILEKHRSGAKGTIHYKWTPSIVKFDEINEEEYKQAKKDDPGDNGDVKKETQPNSPADATAEPAETMVFTNKTEGMPTDESVLTGVEAVDKPDGDRNESDSTTADDLKRNSGTDVSGDADWKNDFKKAKAAPKKILVNSEDTEE